MDLNVSVAVFDCLWFPTISVNTHCVWNYISRMFIRRGPFRSSLVLSYEDKRLSSMTRRSPAKTISTEGVCLS